MARQVRVVDIECNGFNPDKIWCVGASESTAKGVKTSVSYHHMAKLFTNPDVVLIAHNGVRFDIPIVERLLGIKVEALVVDTLALSWYLHPSRAKHGLASWGEEFGVPKPVVEDWEDQPIEVYLDRVVEDVKINTKLWEKFFLELMRMYKTEEKVWRFIEYLTFKMECAREQEEVKWKLDIPRAQKNFDKLSIIRDEKFGALQRAMPDIPVMKKRRKPAKPYKIDGSLSAIGVKWFNLLKDEGLPEDYEGEIKVVDGYNPPNAGSPLQVKNWLYSLGWTPTTFKFKRDKETNETKEIPQINNSAGDDVCESIKRLFDTAPELKVLEGLSIVKHRLGIFKGFLENVDEQGFLQARIMGLTNTLRFKHTEIVNLPAVDKPYGEEVRACLVCEDNEELMGSDMEALEDRTKQHYMMPHDPKYVNSMREEGYCPHVDIAKLAGYVTEEEEARHKTGVFFDKHDKKHIKNMRKKAKPVNYGSVYGQKPKGLARETGMSLKDAKSLYDIYWERNWSVNVIAEEQRVVKANGKSWLLNPVSGFLYSLRNDKDRFSTLNQGTGVYCFDMWVKGMRERGLKMCGQMHDEVIHRCPKEDRGVVENIVKEAMVEVNEKLQLNVALGCDVQFGNSYADIH